MRMIISNPRRMGLVGLCKKFKKDIKYVHYDCTIPSYTIEWKTGEMSTCIVPKEKQEQIHKQIVDTGLLRLPF